MSLLPKVSPSKSASPSWLRALSSWGNGLFLVVVLLLLALTTLRRYPTDREVLQRLGVTDSEKVIIKESEAEVGAYHVVIEREGKPEELFLETYAQWVLPGQSYDWDAYDLEDAGS